MSVLASGFSSLIDSLVMHALRGRGVVAVALVGVCGSWAMAADYTVPPGVQSGTLLITAVPTYGNVTTTAGVDDSTTVTATANVTMRATGVISLMPGFHAQPGSTLLLQLYSPPSMIGATITANPTTVAGTTTTLSAASVTDDLPESALVYTWSATTVPVGGSATFAASNGTNAGKSLVATLTKAGSYQFICTVRDQAALTAASAPVAVTVQDTPTQMLVTPASATVASLATQTFSASVKNQFGQVMATQPSIVWTTAGGTITMPGGVYTPVTTPGSYTVTATTGAGAGLVTATATVTVTALSMPMATIVVPASTIVYRNSDTTGGMTTTSAYTWRGTSNRVATVTVTAPIVTTAQNGSATATTTAVSFDGFGRPQWTRDQDSFLTYLAYDQVTGSPVTTIAAVDTSTSADFTALPSGWSSTGTPHLKTVVTVDNLGRPRSITDPAGQVTWMVYKDAQFEVRTYHGWTGSAATGPVDVKREDRANNYRERISTRTAALVSGSQPTGTEALTASDFQSFERELLDDNFRVQFHDQYVSNGFSYTATSLTFGTASTSSTSNTYERSTIGYDSRGRVERVVDATTTISRTVYDALSRPVSTWSGTGTADSGWSSSSTGSMAKRSSMTYDGGSVGNGTVTRSDVFADATTSYATYATYDFRDRVVTTRAPDAVVTKRTYDHLSRVTMSETYANGGIDGSVTAANRRGRSETFFDERGQAYQASVSEVNPVTGTLGTVMTSKMWYNARGLVVKTCSPSGLLSKTVYDGAGRVTCVTQSVDAAETTYADALTASDDKVIETAKRYYNLASRPVLMATFKRKDNDASSIGALTPANAFRQAQVSWYDLANRPIASANYGQDNGTLYIYDANNALLLTNGVPTVAAGAVPARSAVGVNAQLTTMIYDLAGSGAVATKLQVTDALGRISETQVDLAGRTLATIENRLGTGVVGNAENDSNRTTTFTYRTGGVLATRVALVPTGTSVASQTTQYQSSSTVDARWITKTIYPDSAADADTVVYDTMGRVTSRTDPRGIVHTYTFDAAGRPSTDQATTIPAVVDATVQRIERTYDDLSRVLMISSYAVPTGGTVQNQVAYTYGGFGQVLTSGQNHEGNVSAGYAWGPTPLVTYAYKTNDTNSSTGAASYLRLASTTYPSNGRTVYQQFPAAGSIGYALNRVDALSDDAAGTAKHAQYTYLGASTVVGITANSQVLDFGINGTNANLDRFGRPTRVAWMQGATVSAGFNYTYDVGNRRLSRAQLQSPAGQDEAYAYDGLDRLSAVNRGVVAVTAGVGTVASPTWQQSWTVGAANTWNQFTVDSDGLGAGSAVTQARVANAANEITSLSGTLAWTLPTYDLAGNLASGPVPTAPTTRQYYTYDAWGRMTQVNADSTPTGGTPGVRTVAYRYDGLNRRIRATFTVAGATTIDDSYYNESYQEIEVWRNAPATSNVNQAYEQYVYDLRFVDAPLKRYRSSANNQTFDETIGYLNDGRWNVTAITNAAGAVIERYRYDPYGLRTALAPDGTTVRTLSSYDNRIGFTGRKLDVLTGLWYFRARYFDSALGQFISRDPMGYVDGSSLYAGYFAGNGYDPFGLCIDRALSWSVGAKQGDVLRSIGQSLGSAGANSGSEVLGGLGALSEWGANLAGGLADPRSLYDAGKGYVNGVREGYETDGVLGGTVRATPFVPTVAEVYEGNDFDGNSWSTSERWSQGLMTAGSMGLVAGGVATLMTDTAANRGMQFLHGTDEASARSIVNDGLSARRMDEVNASVGDRRDLLGFHMTDDLSAADAYARSQAGFRGGNAAVVTADQSALAPFLRPRPDRAGEFFIPDSEFSNIPAGTFRFHPGSPYNPRQ